MSQSYSQNNLNFKSQTTDLSPYNLQISKKSFKTPIKKVFNFKPKNKDRHIKFFEINILATDLRPLKEYFSTPKSLQHHNEKIR